MFLSTWGLIGVSAVVTVPITWALTRYAFSEESKDFNGCLSFFGVTFLIYLFLNYLLPSVIIVYYNDDGKIDYKTRSVLFSSEDQDFIMLRKYIDNQTDRELSLYPVAYGTGNAGDIRDNLIRIEPHSCIETKHEPDEFFRVPSSIRASGGKKGEVRWVLY